MLRDRRTATGLLALGVGLSGLALPHLGAAVAELPTRPIVERLEAGIAVPVAALDRLETSAARALTFRDDGRYWRMRGAAALHRAARTGDPDEAQDAAMFLLESLKRSPADTYGWTRLAYAHVLAGRPEDAADALVRSLHTGRWERELAFDRVAVAGLLATHLPPEAFRRVLEQVAWCWDLDRPRLLQVLDPRRHWPLYRRALADRPDALAVVARRVGLD